MKKKTKILLAIICIVALLYAIRATLVIGAIVKPTNARDNADVHKQKEMLGIIIKAGDLAPVPRTAHVKFIRTEGNMFTRSFRMEFSADAKTVKQWLAASPGIRTAKIIKTNGAIKYDIKPKDGYQHAEAVVDKSGRSVKLYVEWS